jgi:hypothetical protein
MLRTRLFVRHDDSFRGGKDETTNVTEVHTGLLPTRFSTFLCSPGAIIYLHYFTVFFQKRLDVVVVVVVVVFVGRDD